jgi:hypothetical protein
VDISAKVHNFIHFYQALSIFINLYPPSSIFINLYRVGVATRQHVYPRLSTFIPLFRPFRPLFSPCRKNPEKYAKYPPLDSPETQSQQGPGWGRRGCGF